jgi:hypothetical protein
LKAHGAQSVVGHIVVQVMAKSWANAILLKRFLPLDARHYTYNLNGRDYSRFALFLSTTYFTLSDVGQSVTAIHGC